MPVKQEGVEVDGDSAERQKRTKEQTTVSCFRFLRVLFFPDIFVDCEHYGNRAR